MTTNYDSWTRLPVFYFPITLGDNLVGYLWGAQNGNAAGFFPHLASGINNVRSSIFWQNRLEEMYRRGLKPAEAIRYWVGKTPDSQYGGILEGVVQGESRTIQELALRLNPDRPLGEGPWIQDGVFPSGTPDNRSEGFSAIAPVPTSNYAHETASPVTFLPVTLSGSVVGYVWASISDEAAGYLPRTAAGGTGLVAGGLWRARLSDAHAAGLPVLEALRRVRSLPANAPGTFGVIDDRAIEQRAPHLSDLRGLAEQA
ncbi:hypothetical protein ACIP5Y_43300 [Nocardia sp. NPDC088792]|uniref:hypothetical protein n=1 Tax=Nocardia sp. NPDC088792 TaxID=3364332 RepID=UPI003810B8AE